MPVIDSKAIFEQIQADEAKLRALGVTEERESAYYQSLSSPEECRDEAQDEKAFRTAIAGLNLSPEDENFVRSVLESGDGR